jgi:hypothetical protein
MEKKI